MREPAPAVAPVGPRRVEYSHHVYAPRKAKRHRYRTSRGTRIEIQVGKGITPYSNKFGALAEHGLGHTAVRVGDTVLDNFRPGGVSYSEFIDDLGGSDFYGTPFVKVVETAF